jgi:hypothetical protein
MRFSAVHREARIPERFLGRPVRPYGKRGDWIDLTLEPGEIKVSIVREHRSAGSDVAPTLVSTIGEATETASSWYATGNPFAIAELVTIPVVAAGPTSRAQFRHLPLVGMVARDLGVPVPAWATAAPGMLPDREMPQNRWLDVSLTALEPWLERWLASSPVIELGDLAPVPADTRARCLYLTRAVGAGGWVKVGKAQDRTAGQRMQAQQLCSPYRLQHLGVWSGANAVGGLGRVETALRRHVARGRETRSEWVNVDAAEALALAADFAERSRLPALWTIDRASA